MKKYANIISMTLEQANLALERLMGNLDTVTVDKIDKIISVVYLKHCTISRKRLTEYKRGCII